MLCIDLRAHDVAALIHFGDAIIILVDRALNSFDNFLHMANVMLPIDLMAFMPNKIQLNK